MNKEIFGVFGGREDFIKFRSESSFDKIVAGDTITVGIRDPGLEQQHWTSYYSSSTGDCVVWGEGYTPSDTDHEPARWLHDQYAKHGIDALFQLNGSYIAIIAREDETIVATDPLRSWECYYTDVSEVRVFGTDAAAVARTITTPTVDNDALLEYLHIGVILGEKTSLSTLHRVPIDSFLTETSVESLDRFVYHPREFDYIEALVTALKQAFGRRSNIPGRKGLLLSAGYDSRTILAGVSTIDACYTIGSNTAQEVRGAKQIANQFHADHTTLNADGRYLYPDEQKVLYSQGIKESLHIHHAGYTDEIHVDVIYHGLLSDTLTRGHFSANDGLDIFGNRVPLSRPDPEPDPATTLLPKLGYKRRASEQLADQTAFDIDPHTFVRDAINTEFEKTVSRADSIQNQLHACGIANQPSLPFHFHLADNFYAPFIAMDIDLINWHLATPPVHRTIGTFMQATKQLDRDLFRHRPPDRPHLSLLLNELERFLRRKTPFIEPFESPWPNREQIYDRYYLNRRLLPELDHLHETIPVRHKLRISDILGWMDQCAPQAAETTRGYLCKDLST